MVKEDMQKDALGALTRINAKMIEGTIRLLGEQNLSLQEQVSSLMVEVLSLADDSSDAQLGIIAMIHSDSQMHEETIRVLGQQNTRLQAQGASLTAQVSHLRYHI